MKYIFILLVTILPGTIVFGQNQMTTTGNNVINTANPIAADIVMGSDAQGGILHDSSIMWWSNGSASRISNTADVFKFSSWSLEEPNAAFSATMGGSSFFKGDVGIGTISLDNQQNWGRVLDEVGSNDAATSFDRGATKTVRAYRKYLEHMAKQK